MKLCEEVLVLLAVAVGSLELALRAAYWLKHRRLLLWAPFDWTDSAKKVSAYVSHPYISYVKRPNVSSPAHPSNNLGYAGRRATQIAKGPGVTRLVVYGGSTVEQNDYERLAPFDPNLTWPQMLEQRLEELSGRKFEVINAGVSGYTSVESLIELQLRGLPLNPDFAIYYQGVNDFWLCQSVADFRSDYSHSRKAPQFPSPSRFPEVRASFVWQYVRMRLTSLRAPPSLITYIVHRIPFPGDLSRIEEKVSVFKRNVRNFCALCLANGVRPVLVPWQFPRIELSNPYGHTFNEQERSQFKEYLDANNRAVSEVAREIDGCVFLDVGVLAPQCFRKNDWTHFSKEGLLEMAARVAEGLVPYVVQPRGTGHSLTQAPKSLEAANP